MVDFGEEVMKCVLESQKRGFEIQKFSLHLPFRESKLGKDEITACIKVMITISFWVIDVKRYQEFWSMKRFVYLSHLSEKNLIRELTAQ